jgi:hypothetical protein
MVPITISTAASSVELATGGAPEGGFPNFLLRQLRCAELRARIVANEIEAMATALRGGLINAETALLHLHETGAIWLLPTSSRE